MWPTLLFGQFSGGFACADPDALFDKEIFFFCQNNATNGYYGLNLQNISVVIDGETQVDFSGVWTYGEYLFLGKSDGFKFTKGSTAALYVNGVFQAYWTCYSSNPTTTEVIKNLWKKKPRTGNMGKNALKVLRKVKKYIK